MKKTIIDIHSHILPFLDDGPSTAEQSLILASKALEEGVSTIIATPHCCNGVYNISRDDISIACLKFRDILTKHGISIDIRPGAEVRLNHDTVKKYDKGELMTLNDSGQYLLLELPETFLVDGVIMLLRQFVHRGITPVIAHPERNRLISGRINIIGKFMDEGALLQITSGSLMGDFGKPVMKMTEALVKMRAVSFLASDIHPGRKYRMADAVKKLGKIVGESTSHAMVHDMAEKLLSFQPEKLASTLTEGREACRVCSKVAVWI